MPAKESKIDPAAGQLYVNAPYDSTFSILDAIPPASGISAVKEHNVMVWRLKPSETSPLLGFLSKNTDMKDEEAARKTLEVFLESTLADFHKSKNGKTKAGKKRLAINASVCIFATKENMCRIWHRDDNRRWHGVEPQSRYSMTLLGPPTDILLPNNIVDTAVPEGMPIPGLGPEVLESQPRCHIPPGRIYRFMVSEGGPVHATPIHDTDRIFLSAVWFSTR